MSLPYPDYALKTATFASGHARARIVVWLLTALIVVNLIHIGSEILQLNYLSRILTHEIVTRDERLSNAYRILGVAFLYFVIYIPTVILFLMWVHRAYKNLPALKAQHLEFSPGWAVGYFFIPILNLFYPYRVMKEIWRKSDPEFEDPDHYLSPPTGVSIIIPLWWGAWLASTFVDRIVFRLLLGERDPAKLFYLAQLGIASSLLNIVSCVLAILVVREINARQEARALRFLAPQTPPPPPIFQQGNMA